MTAAAEIARETVSQVASANIVLEGKVMYGMAYVSDLFQRISP
jgi:hypothetical protein